MRITIQGSLGIAMLLTASSALAEEPVAAQASVPLAPTVADLPPPPPPHPAVFAPAPEPTASGAILAGYHGSFFIRDAADHFRLYPRGRIHVDSHIFAGKGVYDMPDEDGGNALMPRLFVRRIRLELAGEMFERFSFNFGADLASQPLSNANGKSEQYAAKAGKDPSAETARYAGVQTAGSSASLADAWINYRYCDCLNFQFGQYQAPFSMENRTSNNSHPWIERNVAIRGFVVPTSKETGLTLWGDVDKLFGYQVALLGGDGQNRPQVDDRVDFWGRAYSRPFSGSKGTFSDLQIGVSARHGERNDDYVGYDYPAISTGQGYQLWASTYKDSEGRTVHIIPSGSQDAFGGELRVPLFDRLALQGEAYWVVNNTREALDGYQLTNTERLGQLKGLGWYAQLSYWPFGDAFVNGDPGTSGRPTHVDLKKPPKPEKKGLELLAIVAGINARYSGAIREGEADEKTPGSTGNPAQRIVIREYGVGATYWHTKHLRFSLNYIAYQTPGSGSSDNLASVPANVLPEKPDTGTHVLHEISTRIGVMF